MGVAPVAPGMPDRASMPDQPSATARATRPSQLSPAATRTAAPPQSSCDSTVIPVVATRTTEPAKPSSATSRLEPPETTSSGSSASSTSRTASTSSSVVSAVTSRCAGPPTRIVVRVDSGVPCSSRMGVGTASAQGHDGHGAAEHLVAVAQRGEVDRGPSGLRVDALDDGTHLDVGPAFPGDHDRLGEAGAVLQHPPGAAQPVRDDVERRAHGEHAVRDHVRQADGRREPLVPVDAVAVEARPGVLHQGGPLDVDGARGQRVAGGDLPGGPESAHESLPRMTIVDVAVQTCSPSTVDSSLRVVTMACPPASRTAPTVSTPTISSPAVIGRWWTKRCSPWTTRLKSMPASGSAMSCLSHCRATSTAKVGVAITSR